MKKRAAPKKKRFNPICLPINSLFLNISNTDATTLTFIKRFEKLTSINATDTLIADLKGVQISESIIDIKLKGTPFSNNQFYRIMLLIGLSPQIQIVDDDEITQDERNLAEALQNTTLLYIYQGYLISNLNPLTLILNEANSKPVIIPPNKIIIDHNQTISELKARQTFAMIEDLSNEIQKTAVDLNLKAIPKNEVGNLLKQMKKVNKNTKKGTKKIQHQQSTDNIKQGTKTEQNNQTSDCEYYLTLINKMNYLNNPQPQIEEIEIKEEIKQVEVVTPTRDPTKSPKLTRSELKQLIREKRKQNSSLLESPVQKSPQKAEIPVPQETSPTEKKKKKKIIKVVKVKHLTKTQNESNPSEQENPKPEVNKESNETKNKTPIKRSASAMKPTDSPKLNNSIEKKKSIQTPENKSPKTNKPRSASATPTRTQKDTTPISKNKLNSTKKNIPTPTKKKQNTQQTLNKSNTDNQQTIKSNDYQQIETKENNSNQNSNQDKNIEESSSNQNTLNPIQELELPIKFKKVNNTKSNSNKIANSQTENKSIEHNLANNDTSDTLIKTPQKTGTSNEINMKKNAEINNQQSKQNTPDNFKDKINITPTRNSNKTSKSMILTPNTSNFSIWEKPTTPIVSIMKTSKHTTPQEKKSVRFSFINNKSFDNDQNANQSFNEINSLTFIDNDTSNDNDELFTPKEIKDKISSLRKKSQMKSQQIDDNEKITSFDIDDPKLEEKLKKIKNNSKNESPKTEQKSMNDAILNNSNPINDSADSNIDSKNQMNDVSTIDNSITENNSINDNIVNPNEEEDDISQAELEYEKWKQQQKELNNPPKPNNTYNEFHLDDFPDEESSSTQIRNRYGSIYAAISDESSSELPPEYSAAFFSFSKEMSFNRESDSENRNINTDILFNSPIHNQLDKTIGYSPDIKNELSSLIDNNDGTISENLMNSDLESSDAYMSSSSCSESGHRPHMKRDKLKAMREKNMKKKKEIERKKNAERMQTLVDSLESLSEPDPHFNESETDQPINETEIDHHANEDNNKSNEIDSNKKMENDESEDLISKIRNESKKRQQRLANGSSLFSSSFGFNSISATESETNNQESLQIQNEQKEDIDNELNDIISPKKPIESQKPEINGINLPNTQHDSKNIENLNQSCEMPNQTETNEDLNKSKIEDKQPNNYIIQQTDLQKISAVIASPNEKQHIQNIQAELHAKATELEFDENTKHQDVINDKSDNDNNNPSSNIKPQQIENQLPNTPIKEKDSIKPISKNESSETKPTKSKTVKKKVIQKRKIVKSKTNKASKPQTNPKPSETEIQPQQEETNPKVETVPNENDINLINEQNQKVKPDKNDSTRQEPINNPQLNKPIQQQINNQTPKSMQLSTTFDLDMTSKMDSIPEPQEIPDNINLNKKPNRSPSLPAKAGKQICSPNGSPTKSRIPIPSRSHSPMPKSPTPRKIQSKKSLIPTRSSKTRKPLEQNDQSPKKKDSPKQDTKLSPQKMQIQQDEYKIQMPHDTGKFQESSPQETSQPKSSLSQEAKINKLKSQQEPKVTSGKGIIAKNKNSNNEMPKEKNILQHSTNDFKEDQSNPYITTPITQKKKKNNSKVPKLDISEDDYQSNEIEIQEETIAKKEKKIKNFNAADQLSSKELFKSNFSVDDNDIRQILDNELPSSAEPIFTPNSSREELYENEQIDEPSVYSKSLNDISDDEDSSCINYSINEAIKDVSHQSMNQIKSDLDSEINENEFEQNNERDNKQNSKNNFSTEFDKIEKIVNNDNEIRNNKTKPKKNDNCIFYETPNKNEKLIPEDKENYNKSDFFLTEDESELSPNKNILLHEIEEDDMESTPTIKNDGLFDSDNPNDLFLLQFSLLNEEEDDNEKVKTTPPRKKLLKKRKHSKGKRSSAQNSGENSPRQLSPRSRAKYDDEQLEKILQLKPKVPVQGGSGLSSPTTNKSPFTPTNSNPDLLNDNNNLIDLESEKDDMILKSSDLFSEKKDKHSDDLNDIYFQPDNLHSPGDNQDEKSDDMLLLTQDPLPPDIKFDILSKNENNFLTKKSKKNVKLDFPFPGKISINKDSLYENLLHMPSESAQIDEFLELEEIVKLDSNLISSSEVPRKNDTQESKLVPNPIQDQPKASPIKPLPINDIKLYDEMLLLPSESENETAAHKRKRTKKDNSNPKDDINVPTRTFSFDEYDDLPTYLSENEDDSGDENNEVNLPKPNIQKNSLFNPNFVFQSDSDSTSEVFKNQNKANNIF